MDNCSAHPHFSCLESIELVFLPPNTTSAIQPCDQGIINALKFHYRKKMVKNLIDCIDRGQRVSDFKITLLDALKMARAAWDRITPATIANCYRKVGFVSTTEQEEAEEEREDVSLLTLCVSEPCTLIEYAMVDENLTIAPSLSNGEIAALVRQGMADDEDDDDDTGDPLPSVTSLQAFAALRDIQAYLLCHCKNADQSYHVLRDLEIVLTETASKACKQTLITDFL